LNTVLSGTVNTSNVSDESNPFDDSPNTTVVVDTKEEPAPTVSVEDSSEDDTFSYFEKLAEDS